MQQGEYFVMFDVLMRTARRAQGWLALTPSLTKPNDVIRIIEVVTSVTGVTELELLSRRRGERLIRARHIAATLMIEMTDMSYAEIGRALNRDHTTILYVKKKMDNRGRGRSLLNTQLAEAKRRLAS